MAGRVTHEGRHRPAFIIPRKIRLNIDTCTENVSMVQCFGNLISENRDRDCSKAGHFSGLWIFVGMQDKELDMRQSWSNHDVWSLYINVDFCLESVCLHILNKPVSTLQLELLLLPPPALTQWKFEHVLTKCAPEYLQIPQHCLSLWTNVPLETCLFKQQHEGAGWERHCLAVRAASSSLTL